LAGPAWSDEEKRACLSLEFDDFHELYPERNWNAYRFKRSRLIEKGIPITSEETSLSSPKPEPREEDWEELFSHLESAEESRRRLSPTDQHIRISGGDEPFALAFMSDIHAGGGGVDYARFRADLDALRETDGVGVIINGDLFENAKHMMKSGEALYHGAFNSPREQYYYIKSRLATIADKIAVISAGNHDTRDGIGGLDRLPDLCRDLGTAYFSEKGGTVFLTVGSQEYVVAVKHEWTGNSQINKSNRTRRMWAEWTGAWENADVVTVGHLHQPDLHTSTQKGRDVHYVQSGTYKHIADGYSEKLGFKPAYGVPIVVFYPDERRIVPFSDFHAGLMFLRVARANYRGQQEYGAA
jgi:predicted phosphodiesterase